jgi:hypothetical protein
MRTKLLPAAVLAVILSTTAVTLASASGARSFDDNDATAITLFSTQDTFTFLTWTGRAGPHRRWETKPFSRMCCSTIVAAARSGPMPWFAP